MRTKRLLEIASLVAAGLAALNLSFVGIFGLSYSPFGPGYHSSPNQLPFLLPFALALPAFLLSLGITRLASYALWILVFWRWSADIWYHAFWGSLYGSPTLLDLFGIAADTLFKPPVLWLAALAGLTQFGGRAFKCFRFDEYFFKKTRGASESGA
jgi:hypothetical protein